MLHKLSESPLRCAWCTHEIHVKDIARYSDLVEDLDTQSYFLLFQEKRKVPMNLNQLVIEHRVLEQPTQSSSLYATK